MLNAFKKRLRIRRLQADINMLGHHVPSLREEANRLQFEVLPRLQLELETLTGTPVSLKPVGILEPAAYARQTIAYAQEDEEETHDAQRLAQIGFWSGVGSILIACGLFFWKGM